MAKKKIIKKKKEKKKNRAVIRDLTTTSELLFRPSRGIRALGGIFQKKHGELKIRFRNSKGHITEPNKRSKIRYELYDVKKKKIVYKGEYRKFKRIPSPDQIVKTVQNYFRKGKGKAFKSTTLKAHKEYLKSGKEAVTIEIEFETP